MRAAPKTASPTKMNADDNTPSSGESVSDASNWETVARELLRSELEHTGGNLRECFDRLALEIESGEPVDPERVDELELEMMKAQVLVEYLTQLADENRELPEGVDVDRREEGEE